MKLRYALFFAVLPAFLGLCTLLNAQDVKPAKILVYTHSEGFEHEPAKMENGTTGTGRALKTYFADKKIEIVETQDGSIFDGDLAPFDAFVFYTQGNLLGKNTLNNENAKPMTADGLQKMIAAVKTGKGFVGIHSATDSHCGDALKSEDGVDLFTKFIGARFTGHGDQQTATLTIVQPTAFPSLKDAGESITTRDEWYAMNRFNTDMHVVLIQETEGMQGRDYARPPFPTTWIRKEGEGRVGYTSFAHDNRYFDDSVQRIGDIIEWAVGRFEADTTPNIEKVTPGYAEMPPRRQQ